MAARMPIASHPHAAATRSTNGTRRSSDRSKGRSMSRVSTVRWIFWFCVLLLVVPGGSTSSSVESGLGGDYVVAGQASDGRAYTGQLRIITQGEGYAIAWRLDQGGDYRGLALKVDNVLGAVYRPDKDRIPGLG